MTHNEQGFVQVWHYLFVRPKPLLIENTKSKLRTKAQNCLSSPSTAWICNWLMFVYKATLAQNLMLAAVVIAYELS
jgi:hypothetical protein